MSDNCQDDLIIDLPGIKKSMPGMSKTAIKIAYLIVVEEPDLGASSNVTKLRFFVSSKLTQSGSTIEFIGYEIKKTSAKKVQSYQDAVDMANKDGAKLVSIIYPWQRIVSVKNVTYYIKKGKGLKNGREY